VNSYCVYRPVCLGLLAALAAAGCIRTARPELASRPAEEPTPQLGTKQAADIQIALARSNEMCGDTALARETYEAALKQDPSRGDAWARLAVLYDQEGRFADSAQCYKKAKANHADDTALACNQGYGLYLQRRWAEAEECLRHAIALDAGNARAHNNLGLVFARNGRAADALDEFARAGCSPCEARVNLALALAVEGDLAEAATHYREALAADPSSTLAQKGLHTVNDILTRQRGAAEAKPEIGRAVDLPQTQPDLAAQDLATIGHPLAAGAAASPNP
jgi:Tfp pilus assembly protein PilF